MQPSHGFVDFHTLREANAPSSPRKYEQLRDFVVSQITTGQFPAGAPLLSEHQIAKTLRMARSTVRQAMSALEREGLVRRIHGKGTYIHEEAPQRIRRRQALLVLVLPATESELYPALQKSFATVAAGMHQQVIVCNSLAETQNQSTLLQRLAQLKVSGVAVVPSLNQAAPVDELKSLRQRGTRVICCCREIPGLEVPAVVIPYRDAGWMAGDLLRKAGHRSVAICTLGGPLSAPASDHERLQVPSENLFSDNIQKNGRNLVDETCEQGFHQGAGPHVTVHSLIIAESLKTAHEHEMIVIREMDRLLAEPNPPSAIFCSCDSLAELLYVVLTRKGIRVPEDLSLVGFGGSHREGALRQRLSSITIQEQELAELAVPLLLNGGSQEASFPVRVSLSLRLYAGQTFHKEFQAHRTSEAS